MLTDMNEYDVTLTLEQGRYGLTTPSPDVLTMDIGPSPRSNLNHVFELYTLTSLGILV